MRVLFYIDLVIGVSPHVPRIIHVPCRLSLSRGFSFSNPIQFNWMMMSSTTRTDVPCTCRAPPCVEITTRQLQSMGEEEGDENGTAASIITPQEESSRHSLLQQNLQTFGWSPIRCRKVGYTVPSHDDIQRIFTSSGNADVDDRLTYRAQEESGGGGHQAIEPKESLELEQSKILRNVDDDDPKSADYCQVRDYCLGLSRIAHTVNRILDIPPNVFLLEEGEENTEERLDLLRVFYYHSVVAVPPSSSSPEEEQEQQLGSSPHTDWGSWTVVWQDSMGGLETYCRHCHKWIPVAAASSSSNSMDDENNNDTWDCIIHVGDMASLALGRGPASSTDNHDADTACGTRCKVQWPSPRHRVVSPTKGERTSLVYFAYPPASCSIQTMQDAISNWSGNDDRGLQLPLSEYYLLHDQSSTSSSSASFQQTVHDTYTKLRSLSIREVIQEKWKQVQRNSE